MPDYSKYHFLRREWLFCASISCVVTGLTAWLFYRSFYALILYPFCFEIVRRQMQKYFHQKQKQQMLYQFQGMLQAIAGLLKAGYSMENAFQEGEKEFIVLYGKTCIMAQEFARINHQLNMNVPIEQLLEDLAQRSGIEEIDSFSQVFGFAKRGGGNIMKIFTESVERITEQTEVKREIETVIAAKKLEQKIMALVPCGILVYLGIAMPEFLNPLYGSFTGVLVMSLCLGIYGCALVMAQKIVEIKE